MARKQRESDKKNSHCWLYGFKLSLGYQFVSTPLQRRLSHGALLPPRLDFEFL